MINLINHAEKELKKAGLFDKESDYGGMLGESTMKLIRCFSKEGHSGMSAAMQIDIFTRLAKFKTLTPLTDDPEEWMNVSEYYSSQNPPCWQNKRDSSCFSTDGGKTYYSVDDEKRTVKESKKALRAEGDGGRK